MFVVTLNPSRFSVRDITDITETVSQDMKYLLEKKLYLTLTIQASQTISYKN
jgi:hypothetical protein